MTSAQPRLRVVGMALGMLLVQAVWIVCVPAFAGMDEWDHAFRADSVAHGQWRASAEEATRGTGAFVAVSPDVVEAANAECARLRYTTDADCVGTAKDGRTVVASGAGRYNPLFYAYIGYAASPFDGSSALYAMRAAAALLTCLMFVVALVCIRSWAKSAWPFVAVAVGLTPTVLYSSAIAAPNGVEMTAGLAWWSSLMGLVLADESRKRPLLLASAAASGSILVTVRSLGPLWAALALLAVLIARPGSVGRLTAILRSRSGAAAVATIGLASAASVAWILSQRSLRIGIEEAAAGAPWGVRIQRALESEVVWLFQAIGAFPYRNEPAPVVVYPLFLLLLLGLLVLAFRRADRRVRQAMLGALAVVVLVPFGVTVATYSDFGVAWQGRYALPYGLGLVVLTGVALNRADRLGWFILIPTFVVYLVGHAIGPLSVLVELRERNRLLESGPGSVVGTLGVALLLVVGLTLLWLSASWSPGPRNSGEGAA